MLAKQQLAMGSLATVLCRRGKTRQGKTSGTSSFVIVSCCSIYAILPSLCLRQGRVLGKDESLPTNESLPTTCLACFRDKKKEKVNFFNYIYLYI